MADQSGSKCDYDNQTWQQTTADVSNTIQDIRMVKNRCLIEIEIEEPNLIRKDQATDIEAQLGPIIEYANEPILPLLKACAPLDNIVPNLAAYVKIALDKTPEQPPDGLTIDESAAIRLYTMEWNEPRQSLYSMLNRTLKKESREHLRPYFKYLKLFLSAIVKIPCGPQETIWRGVRKNLSAEFPSGMTTTWWGFSSCTTEMSVLENPMFLGDDGSRTLFSVEAINSRPIHNHSEFDTENERLLLPGTQLVVQSQVSPAPDLYIIHLKQIIPDQLLLSPPFKGNVKRFIKHD